MLTGVKVFMSHRDTVERSWSRRVFNIVVWVVLSSLGGWGVVGLGKQSIGYMDLKYYFFGSVVLDNENLQNDGFLAALEGVALPGPQSDAVAFDGSAWRVVILIERDRLRLYEIGDRVLYQGEPVYPSQNDSLPVLEIPLLAGLVPKSKLRGQWIPELTESIYRYRDQVHALGLTLDYPDSPLDDLLERQGEPLVLPTADGSGVQLLTVKPKLLLAVHPDVPFGTVRQVSSTVGQAGVSQIEYLCRVGDELRMNPSKLTLVMEPDENDQNLIERRLFRDVTAPD